MVTRRGRGMCGPLTLGPAWHVSSAGTLTHHPCRLTLHRVKSNDRNQLDDSLNKELSGKRHMTLGLGPGLSIEGYIEADLTLQNNKGT